MHFTANVHSRIVITNVHFWLLIVAMHFSFLWAVVSAILAFLTQRTQLQNSN